MVFLEIFNNFLFSKATLCFQAFKIRENFECADWITLQVYILEGGFTRVVHLTLTIYHLRIVGSLNRRARRDGRWNIASTVFLHHIQKWRASDPFKFDQIFFVLCSKNEGIFMVVLKSFVKTSIYIIYIITYLIATDMINKVVHKIFSFFKSFNVMH